MSNTARILIVDDDRALLQSCARMVGSWNGYRVQTAAEAESAESAILSGEYDLIISDLAMPAKSGLDLLKVAQTSCPDTPFVIFSAYGSIENAVSAMRAGAFDFIQKPFKAERLKVVVEKSLAHRNLFKEKQALEEQLDERCHFDDIVGRSAAMRRVFDRIERVAESDVNIMISGESGTGKELVARSIHSRSGRKNQAFVPVNCGAFPENLFESELFGYEKGAFTGAERQKPGLMEYASGGTFFLDEICELSPALQVKLLRVLQDKKIRRVGGTQLIDVDVRLISASNCDMQKAVESGAMREDLYYRLNVISIEMPPLRDREQDISLLANHFVAKLSQSTTKQVLGIDNNAMQCLNQYRWPGNVRELENVIERAITLARDEWLQAEDLPDTITNVCDSPHNTPVDLSVSLKEAKRSLLDRFEKEYLEKMLHMHKGNISQAAHASDIDRRTFHRLINRYSIDVQNMMS